MSTEETKATDDKTDAPALAAKAPAAPEPEKDPNTVTLTVDGMEVTVPKGTQVIEAAKQVGVNISSFCYHPGLSIAANCRQCLVSIEKSPKLQPSCQATASDGMVVSTKDKVSTLARKQMLEFTLVNHPIDCPICDKAGECRLQELYFDHDNADSRVNVPKVKKDKAVDLGPTVVLDQERCILCTRCIRVCDEVAGEHQLEMSNRGNKERLGTAPGALLDNPYSLNTVDVCPVGALTSKDFRFTMRAWELMMTPSVCNGCSTGCNIELHHRNNRVWRIIPRHNEAVNKYWMCDDGRMTYKTLRKDRVAAPLIKGLPNTFKNALAEAARRLTTAMEGDHGRIGVVFSMQHNNEDNYALAKLARDIWELNRFYKSGKASDPDKADEILRDEDLNPNRAGVIAILGEGVAAIPTILDKDLAAGELSTLIVLGNELPLSDEAMARAAGIDNLIVIADRETGLAAKADVLLPSAAWAEAHGTVTNRQNTVQRMHGAVTAPGEALPAWQIIAMLGQACGAAMQFETAKSVFNDMKGSVAAFKDADWGRPHLPVQLRFANSRG